MIVSPCKGCSKAMMPKDVCVKTCKKLRDVQEFQVTNQEDVFTHRVDYVEEKILVISG